MNKESSHSENSQNKDSKTQGQHGGDNKSQTGTKSTTGESNKAEGNRNESSKS